MSADAALRAIFAVLPCKVFDPPLCVYVPELVVEAVANVRPLATGACAPDRNDVVAECHLRVPYDHGFGRGSEGLAALGEDQHWVGRQTRPASRCGRWCVGARSPRR